jgi:NitT/TauT family transport system substrate-binding protein
MVAPMAAPRARGHRGRLRQGVARWVGLAWLVALLPLAGCNSAGGAAPSPPAAAAKPAPAGAAPAAQPAAGTAASPPAAAAAPGAPSAAPAPLITVRMALPTLDLANLPLAAGQWTGTYQAEGLEVELLQIGGQAALPALLNGEVQFLFGWGATSGGLLQGAPVKVLAVLLDRPPHQVVVRPEIGTAADLRGKRIAVARAGSSDEVLMERALQTAGLRLTDTEVVRLGETTPRFSALVAGQVDAATLTEPFASQAEQQGLRVLVRGRDLLQLPVGVVATTTQLLDERRDIVRRFLRATARNLAYLQNPAALPEIVQQATVYFQLDPAQAELLVRDAITWASPNGEAPDVVLTTALDTARATADKPDPIPPAAVFDFSLLRDVRREAGLP